MSAATESLTLHRDFDCSSVAVEELSELCRVFAAYHGEVITLSSPLLSSPLFKESKYYPALTACPGVREGGGPGLPGGRLPSGQALPARRHRPRLLPPEEDRRPARRLQVGLSFRHLQRIFNLYSTSKCVSFNTI